MNKKVEKAIGKALAASLVTGVAASVAPSVSAAEVDFNQLYKTAYNAVTKAKAEGTQAAINEARTAINALKGTKAEFAVGEFSKQVDTVQGPKLVKIVKAIMAAQASGKQADINAAKALIEPELPAIWKNSYSQATDLIQQALVAKTEAAVKKAVDTKLQADIDAAKALVAEVKTAAVALIADWATAQEAKVAAIVVDTKIDAATAVGAKKIEVKFSQAVDTAKAVVSVSKGTSNVSYASVTFAADKKSAVIEFVSNLTDGTYAVKVAGVADAALTANVAVQNEAVTKIEILSGTAVLDRGSNTQLTVGYRVLNQYGEAISNHPSLTVTSSRGSGSATGGVLTINTGTAVNAGDKLAVTIVESSSAKFVSQELTVGLEAKASTIAPVALLDNAAATVTTIKQEDNTNAFYLKLDVKDQYGAAFTSTANLADDLIATSSNPGVIDVVTATTTSGTTTVTKPVFVNNIGTAATGIVALSLDAKNSYGDAIITLISKSTGYSVQYKVSVTEAVKVDSVKISAPTASLIAGQDVVYFPLEVVDNKGNAVTSASSVTAGTTTGTDLVFSVSGGTFNQLETINGVLNAKVTVGDFTSAGTLVLTATTETGKVDTEIAQVKETAVPNAILGVTADTQNVIFKGESVTLANANLVLQDQYGRAYDQARGWSFTRGTGSSAVTTAFNFTVAEVDANNDNASSAAKTITALAKGTKVFTLTLTKTVTDANGTTTTNVANSSTDVTFRTVDIAELSNFGAEVSGKLYADSTATATSASAYAKELKVYGMTSDGKKVYLPMTQGSGQTLKTIYSVLNGSAYVNVAAVNGYGKINGVENTGRDNADGTATADVTKDVTLTFVINDKGDEFTKAVTVSEVAPVVNTVVFKNGSNEVITAADFDYSANVANGTLTFDVNELPTIVVTDDYGVDNATLGGSANVDRLTFSSIVDKDGGAEIRLTNNGVDNTAAISGLESGDTFKVTAVLDGKTVTLNVTVVD